MAHSILPKEAFLKNAEIYKILANPKRLEILNLLRSRECSVHELTKILKIRKANVSQHLALLRHTRLVSVRRNGKGAHYTLVDPKIIDPCRILYELWKNN